MNNELSKRVKQFIEGEWLYNKDEKILKKTFASDQELKKLNLIDAEGYLDSKLKIAMIEALGPTIMTKATGPFGDSDIFSGDMLDDGILYNLEFHAISDDILAEFKKIPNIIIK